MDAILNALPADTWAVPQRLLDRFGGSCDRLAFLLIRPDAIRQGQAADILRHAAGAGLQAVDAEVVRPHPRHLEELYRYTHAHLMREGNRPMWWYLPRYYRLGPAVAVLLAGQERGTSASEHLAALKGPSNPALTKPGQIRYDYRSQNMVMSVVHSSDDTRETLREAGLFFAEPRIANALRQVSAPGTPVCVTDLLGQHGVPTQPCSLPNFHQVLAGLQMAIMERPVIAAHPDLARSAAPVVSDLSACYRESLAHPDYRSRTRELERVWNTSGSELLGRLEAADDEELAILRWSARMRNTVSALADIVIDFLRDRGYALDDWDQAVLETGWGFHDMIAGNLPAAEPSLHAVDAL